MSKGNRAVVAFIFKENKILCVSRKNNKKDFGLPGGKVESKEKDTEALYRELLEETGINSNSSTLLYTNVDGEFLVSVYALNDISFQLDNIDLNKEYLNSKELTIMKFLTIEEFLNPNSTFYEFNKNFISYLREVAYI
jgi:8-oxo-dGTP pyrophosphatase MutT (NUDIX family)